MDLKVSKQQRPKLLKLFKEKKELDKRSKEVKRDLELFNKELYKELGIDESIPVTADDLILACLEDDDATDDRQTNDSKTGSGRKEEDGHEGNNERDVQEESKG